MAIYKGKIRQRNSGGTYDYLLPETTIDMVNGLQDELDSFDKQLVELIVNVTVYGAKGDGVTDDTQAFVNAINYLKSKGGGTLFIPNGIYLTNFELPSNVIIKGNGINNTIIKSVPGSNLDVIKGENFDTLSLITTPVSNQGVRHSSVENITVDGNKSNNTSGYGIRIWGCYFSLKDIFVQNCAEDGILTKFTTHVNPTPSNFRDQLLESYFNNIKIAYCRNGWIYNGPHDSIITNLVIIKCSEYAFNQTGSSGGMVGHDWNFWSNGNNIKLANTLSGSNIVANADGSGIGIEFLSSTSGSRLTNIRMTGFNKGIVLRGSAHNIKGSFSDISGDVITLEGTIRSNLEIVATNNVNLINNISEAGANSIKITSNQPTGNVFVGTTLRSDDFIDINVGSISSNAFQIPSRTIKHYGWSPRLPESNGTIITTDSQPTGTLRGGVLKQNGQADVTTAPTSADFNRLLADLRRAGVIS